MNKKFKLSISSTILSLTFVFVIPSASSKQDSTTKIDMLTLSQIPYGFVTPEGKTTGVLYEILNNIMALSGVEKPNNIVPFKRVLARIHAKQQFCTIAAGTSQSAELFDLVEPIGYRMSAGILPAKGIDLVNYASLKNIQIAAPLGAYVDKRFNNDTTLQKVVSSKYVNAMKMLINGRVDAVAGAMPALTYIAKTKGLSKHSFGKPLVFEPFDVYLVCTYGIPSDIRQKLKNALVKLKSNGKVHQILKRYSWDAQN